MSLKNQTLLWTCILLLGACATYNSARRDLTSIPTLEEQCKILSKKHQLVQPKKSKRKPNKVNRNQAFKTEEFAFIKKEVPAQELSFADSFHPDSVSVDTIGTENYSLTASLASERRNEPIINSVANVNVEKKEGISSSSIAKTIQTSRPGIDDNFVPALIGISAVISMLLLGIAQHRSMQLSYWAMENPWKARGIITAAHVITGTGALIIGNRLSSEGLIISETAKYIALSAFATSVCLYPVVRSTNYFKPRFYDAILFASGATLMVYAGNHYEVSREQNPNNAVYSYANYTGENPWYVVRKEISIPKEKAQDPQKKKKSDKTGLTILACIGFTILEFFVLAFSCNLSCAGNQGLAALVGFGGTAGLIIGLVFVIKSIFKEGRKRKRKNPEPQTYKS